MLKFETISKIVIVLLTILVLILNTCLGEALKKRDELSQRIEKLEAAQKDSLERIENLEKYK